MKKSRSPIFISATSEAPVDKPAGTGITEQDLESLASRRQENPAVSHVGLITARPRWKHPKVQEELKEAVLNTSVEPACVISNMNVFVFCTESCVSVHNMSVYEGSCGVGCDIPSSLVL